MNVPELLIVPFGIETNYLDIARAQAGLLIVPFGIETAFRETYKRHFIGLLIVPFGIETH